MAGRTDKGVHAHGQAVQFHLDAPLATDTVAHLHKGLNALLPRDARVLSVCRTPPDFSVQVSALSREYHYHLAWGEVADPLARRTCAFHCGRLDADAMQEAAKVFEGTHDFAAFSSAPRTPKAGGTVRAMHRAECVRTGDAQVRFEVRVAAFWPAERSAVLIARPRTVAPLGASWCTSSAVMHSLWHMPCCAQSAPLGTFQLWHTCDCGRARQLATDSVCLPSASWRPASAHCLVLCVQFVGEGFLFRMVRHLAGACLAVGSGRTTTAQLRRWLRDGVPPGGRGSHRGWATADACGLHKIRVAYPSWESVEQNMHTHSWHDAAEQSMATAAELESE